MFLLAGITCIIFGATKTRDIFTQVAFEEDIEFYDIVDEFQLIEDTTFDGIHYKNGKVYSTYDRTSEDGGKKACPT